MLVRLHAVLLVFVLGCGSAAKTATPVITLVSPLENAKISLPMGAATVGIPVSFTVTNFILEPPVGQPVEAGHGHCHLFLDADTSYVDSGISPLTAPNVPAGIHMLSLELHDNEHGLIEGVLPVSVSVVVQ